MSVLSRRCLIGLAALSLCGCVSTAARKSGGDATPAEPISAEPMPLDAADPRYAPYLTLVRDTIQSNWRHPCVKSASTDDCEYKSAHLVVEFGILKSGRVQFVHVRESSGLSPYDEAAVEAIKQSGPFPEVPPAIMAAQKAGASGVAIMARFNYVPTHRLQRR